MGTRLQLSRPLVCFDLETTGLDPQTDRIVEIACVKTWPDGRQEEFYRRCNPGQPIGAGASAVHGIHDADVADQPTFCMLADDLMAFFRGADLTGFNIERFDLPLLKREFERLDRAFPDPSVLPPPEIIDSMRIFMRQEPRDLAAAYRFYCKQTLQDAHSALADARAAGAILAAQVERYADLPDEVPALGAYCHPPNPNAIDPDGKLIWVDDRAALSFGRYRQRTLQELSQADPDYLRWMASANFSVQVKEAVQGALLGNFLQRPAPNAEP
jgi:DNA polymerase-3 subunit epsilon